MMRSENSSICRFVDSSIGRMTCGRGGRATLAVVRLLFLTLSFFTFSLSAAYTSASYKQEGLINQWDAIDNAGVGLHSSTTNVWKDLKGSLDLTLTANGSWGDNWLNVSGSSAAATKAASAYKTIEIVFRSTSGRIVFCSGIRSRWLLCDISGSNLQFYFDGDKSTRYYQVYNDATQDRFFSAVYDDANTVTNIYDSGVSVDSGSKQNTWNLGGQVRLGDRYANASYPWYGRIYAIRLYDHALSPEELLRHRVIDGVRFFGEADLNGGLVVTGFPNEYQVGGLPSYGETSGHSEGDTLDFTAPTESITISDREHAFCSGWKIYRCNLATGEYEEESASTEENKYACRYVHGSTAGKVVWQWDAEYLCTATAGTLGTVDFSSGWVSGGEPFTVTATANSGYIFKCWEGAPAGHENENPLSVYVSEPLTLTATFIAERSADLVRIDKDASGVPTNAVISISAGGDDDILAVTWGTEDKGANFSAWDCRYYIRRLDAAASDGLEVAIPALVSEGWGTTAKEIRFFVVTGDTATPPGAEAYVGLRHASESGVIAIWDGIENKELGAAHDSGYGHWTDLSGHNLDWPLNHPENWTEKGLRLTSSLAGTIPSSKPITGIATMELVHLNTSTGWGIILMPGYDGTQKISAVTTANWISLYYGVGIACDSVHTQHVAGVYNALVAQHFDGQLYSNGVAVASRNVGNDFNTQGSTDTFLGARTGGGWPATGEIFALRLYNRKLSAAEIAYNYEIDSLRYGLSDAGLWVTDPIVEGVSESISSSSAPVTLAYEYQPAHCGTVICSKEEITGADEVTLTFIPEDGFTFLRWEGLDDGDDATANPITITPAVSRTVKAVCRGDYQLAENGSDDADGVHAPWRTLDHAYAEMAGNSTLTIGEGTFPVSNTVDLAAGMTITGAGAGKTVVTPISSAWRSIRRGFRMSHADNRIEKIAISGFKVNGSSAELLNGCGLWMSDGVFADGEVVGCYGNGTGVKGGGICMSGGIVTNCVIAGNSLANGSGARMGGGIYMTNGTVEDCDIYGNTTGSANNNDQGEGVNIAGGTLRNCRVHDNYGCLAQVCSAGVYVTGKNALVENCVISGNRPLGLRIDNVASTVRNCLIHSNSHATGVATGAAMAGGTLENCTITANLDSSDGLAPGLRMSAGTAVNNIIWGNGANYLVTGSASVTAGTFNTNLTDVAVAVGTGNLEGDAKLSPNGRYPYLQLANSPAVNRGARLDWMTGSATDLIGMKRIIGSAPDLGCYERRLSGFSLIAR